MWRQDVWGSIAHARMLASCNILTPQEAEQIVQGLLELGQEIESGALQLAPDAEDIHTFIEASLHNKIGPVAGKLHTARSRNDQVATDSRLWVKDAIRLILLHLHYLQEIIVSTASKHTKTLMPGLTHQQHAQPVSLAHHLMAYFWMFERDFERLWDCQKRMDYSPLGSGALAGTSFAINRRFTAEELGFSGVVENSMDAVSDRDFAAEFIFACSLMMVHLSRLSQELISWSSPEFGYVTLDDAFTTGSSIMPQKKNPDIAELIRGRSALAIGNTAGILSLLKGLMLTYNRDLQDDKPLLFGTFDIALPSLDLMAAMISTAEWNVKAMRAASRGDFSTATELADYLVQKGETFREAHRIVGEIVLHCISDRQPLEKVTLAQLRKRSKLFGEDALELIRPERALMAHNTEGGPSPKRVQEQIRRARRILRRHEPFAE